jgi:mannonate dehydratase
MKIGTRISPGWLDRPDDLKFLKQIGVDYVDITLDIVQGYEESGGRATREALEEVVTRLGDVGLRIERANSLNRHYENTFLGRPGSEREIENGQVNAELCGLLDIPLLGIQAFQASQVTGSHGETQTYVEGRGGYRHLKVDLASALGLPQMPGAPTREHLWERTLDIYRDIVPVAEKAGVNLAMHGNDPPVPSINGVPQVLYDFAAFDRLFAEVPSPNNGMTFCVGTRYESGEDIFEGIRHFGAQGKLFHVHFRNVRGTIPAQKGYEEVMPDEGDLSMYRVAKALHDTGYEGVIDYDHIMRLSTDGPAGREYIAYCVGHMRGILQSLDSE